jgi:uncharacterized protein (TIGR02391 family)
MFELLQEFPDSDTLLELQPEELGTKMLFFMKKRERSPFKHQMAGNGSKFLLSAFEDELWGISPLPRPTPYPRIKAAVVNTALSEAWAWLEHERWLTPEPGTNGQNGWRQLSRKAKETDISSDFVSTNAVRLFPKKQIHPLIANTSYPAFLRGKYDTAILEAFREVEIAVRKAGNLSQNKVGEELMKAAFASAENNRPPGPLTDTQLPAGEQRSMCDLFVGAFGVYRNSTAHRYVPTTPEDAVEVIMFASQLMRIVERLKPKASGGAQPLRQKSSLPRSVKHSLAEPRRTLFSTLKRWYASPFDCNSGEHASVTQLRAKPRAFGATSSVGNCIGRSF